jgi:hypothetical protein
MRSASRRARWDRYKRIGALSTKGSPRLTRDHTGFEKISIGVSADDRLQRQALSFDDLVGAGEEQGGNGQAER